jgi:hypothetical protein
VSLFHSRSVFSLVFWLLLSCLALISGDAFGANWTEFKFSSKWAKVCNVFSESKESYSQTRASLIQKSKINQKNLAVKYMVRRCELSFVVVPHNRKKVYLKDGYPTNDDPDSKESSSYFFESSATNNVYWIFTHGQWGMSSPLFVNKKTGFFVDIEDECSKSTFLADRRNIVAICSGPYRGNNRILLAAIFRGGEIKRNEGDVFLAPCQLLVSASRREAQHFVGAIVGSRQANAYGVKGTCREVELSRFGDIVKIRKSHVVDYTIKIEENFWTLTGHGHQTTHLWKEN